MKHYQTPNTQVVCLSSGDVLDNFIFLGVSIGPDSSGGVQETAMSPRRIYIGS